MGEIEDIQVFSGIICVKVKDPPKGPGPDKPHLKDWIYPHVKGDLLRNVPKWGHPLWYLPTMVQCTDANEKLLPATFIMKQVEPPPEEDPWAPQYSGGGWDKMLNDALRTADSMIAPYTDEGQNEVQHQIMTAIDNGANVNYVDEEYGCTALMWAAAYATVLQEPAIELLIDANANVDAQDKTGLTALMWAAQYGFGVAVEALLR